MTNAPPDPGASNPFRRAFGGKARDPASIADAMRQAEQDQWERQASAIEAPYRFTFVFLGPPVMYLIGLMIRRGDLAVIAYLLWGLATFIGTPWLLLRIDNDRPPGDSAKAAALLGYGLLGWPLSLPAFMVLPLGSAFVLAFPIVFLWSVGFAIWAVRSQPKPMASVGRARMLAGGGLAYLIMAAGLAALAYALFTGAYDRFIFEFAPAAGLVTSAVAFACSVAGVFVLRTASKTWRRAQPG